MRLKNGMSIEEIKTELLGNSVWKNEYRQIKSPLLYDFKEDFKYDYNICFKNKILLPVQALIDYENNFFELEYKDILNNNILNNSVISGTEDGYDVNKEQRHYIINDFDENEKPSENILLKEIIIQLNSNFNNEYYEYSILTKFFLNDIILKNIAIGVTANFEFCLFLENDNKMIVFGDFGNNCDIRIILK